MNLYANLFLASSVPNLESIGFAVHHQCFRHKRCPEINKHYVCMISSDELRQDCSVRSQTVTSGGTEASSDQDIAHDISVTVYWNMIQPKVKHSHK